MTTITEDYVSFEIAKLLKKKGFNERLLTFYITDEAKKEGYFQLMAFTDDKIDNNHSDHCYLAPTLQMAMKWLREEKRISIIIEFDVTKRGYCPYVYQLDYDMDWVVKWRVNTPMKYEEAVESALKYCLENLI